MTPEAAQKLVAGAARDVFVGVDAELAEAQDRVGDTIVCPSCSEPSCCKHIPYCHLFEAAPAVRGLIAEGPPDGLLPALQETGALMAKPHRGGYFSLGRSCPLLADKRCTVYPRRPAVCRAHTVLDASTCSSGRLFAPAVNTRSAFEIVARHAQPIYKVAGLEQTSEWVFYGTLPQMFYLWITAFQRGDWREYLHAQVWPSVKEMRMSGMGLHVGDVPR